MNSSRKKWLNKKLNPDKKPENREGTEYAM
jgi:hypothetical protein